MLFSVNSFWGSLWSCIFHVFSFISSYFLRFSVEKNAENGCDYNDVGGEETDDQRTVENADDEKKSYDEMNEKEVSKVDSEEVGSSVCNVGTSKYQFFVGNSVCAFIEEPHTMNFTVHEVFVISNDVSSPRKALISANDSFLEEKVHFGLENEPIEVVESNLVEHGVCDELNREIEVVEQVRTEDSVCDMGFEGHELGRNDFDDRSGEEKEEVVVDDDDDDDDDDDQEKAESFVFSLSYDEQEVSSLSQGELSEKEEILSVENEVQVCDDDDDDQVNSSLANSDDFWSSIHKYDCYIGSNDDDEFDGYDDGPKEISCFKVSCGDSPSSLGESSIDENNCQLDDALSVQSEQLGEVYSPDPYNEPPVHIHEHIPKRVSVDLENENDNDNDNDNDDDDEIDQELKGIDASERCDEGDTQMGEVDVLLEQKELIRQMKKEMRQLKINGLPTILEESESPRVEDDLRPLRIDERMGHKDRMDEIFTFYKRYLDKMRKLDILSQQTMYAIGLLQLKHQGQLALNKKGSVPAIKSLLAQNFWSHKLRKHESDPVQKLIREFRSELELVYIGQLCLSWEMLKWQHHKLEELKSHDPDGFRQYNQGTGEFQKFQVLLQRFTEDEPYHQGPRVQHYLKSRCSHPNLLQVPLIKEDPKGEWRGDGEGAIPIGTLKEVIAASLRSFWEFLRADKDELHVVTLMGLHGVHVELQDPSDSDFLSEIRSSLQKKEKRLKDLIKSGNCLVRKFQKHQDQRLSHEMFLAQVELRLVSRVLHMSKLTTDQLLWCHKKINRINITGRKVYIESSFLLFPC